MKHPLACALALALAAGTPALTYAPAAGRADPRIRRAEPRFQSVLRRQHAAAAVPRSSTRSRTPTSPRPSTSGMADSWRKSSAIANNPAEPTFDNTIVAMEKTGRMLDARRHRVLQPGRRRHQRRAREDRRRVRAEVRRAQRRDPPEPEAVRAHQGAVRPPRHARPGRRSRRAWSSATTPTSSAPAPSCREADKAKLKDDQRPSWPRWARSSARTCWPKCNASAVVVDTRAELDGLSDAQIAAAAEAAKPRKLDGKYVLALLNTTGQPPAAQLTNRALREKLHKASIARGSRGNEFDNTAIVAAGREAARRTRQAARLPEPRRLRARGRDREDPGGRQRRCSASSPRRGRQRATRSRRPAGDDRQGTGGQGPADVQARAVGLGLLLREGAQGRSTTSTRSQLKPYFEIEERAARTACSSPPTSSTA